MYSSRNTNKLKTLLRQDKRVFSSSDLALLWEIDNKNTLWTTLKRYTKKHILYRIQRGLYSTLPLDKVDPFEIGSAISGPSSYITTETVLQQAGIIMQSVNKITLVGPKTKEFVVGENEFLCRYLNPKYLLNTTGLVEKKTYTIATPARAGSDLLHINPHYYFDNQPAIDKLNLKHTQQKVGYL